MSIRIQNRDFTDTLAQPPLQYSLVRHAWDVMGGPKTAQIQVTGSVIDIWWLVERLRCPVTIYSTEGGDPLWWGYVHQVTFTDGAWDVDANLDSMANRVAVAYNDANGDRQTTAWQENAASIAEYGYKELLYSSQVKTDAEALAIGAMILTQRVLPRPVITASSSPQSGPETTATLYCVGWMDTLGWRYYGNASETPVDTATQIYNIATAAGQFITAIDLDCSSGLVTNPLQNGDTLALSIIQTLLGQGTTNLRRMLATVDVNRRLRIYEQPAISTSPNLLRRDGTLCDTLDNPLRKETCPVGIWCKLKDIVPPSVDLAKIADPTLVFVDGAEYELATDNLTLTPWGNENPWEIGKIVDG